MLNAFPSTRSSSLPTARPGSIERARTTLEVAFPFQGTPVAVDAFDPSTARLLTTIQDMTDVMIVASLIIAACSLAVNIAAGLGERKRPFSLLRLTGVPSASYAESSHWRARCHCSLSLRSRSGLAWCRRLFICTPRSPLRSGYLAWRTGRTVLGGLVASLAIIASTFPLLNRMTGPEVARNE